MLKKILAAGALLCCALAAHAQGTIRIYHVFTPAALSYLSTVGKTPQQWIDLQMASATSAFTASSVNFSFDQPASPAYGTFNTSETRSNYVAINASYDAGIAATRDATGSTIVVTVSCCDAVDELAGPTAFATTPMSTTGVDVAQALIPNGFVWLHNILDHAMLAGHQRAVPGSIDGSTARGYVLKREGSVATCRVQLDVTASRVGLDNTISVTSCAGWAEPWLGAGAQACSMQLWCDDYARYAGPINQGTNGPAFLGVVNPPPPTYSCSVYGHDSSNNQVFLTGQPFAAPSTPAPGRDYCQNIVRIGLISGQSVYNDDGLHMGSSVNDNITYLNGVSAAVAALGSIKRVPYIFEACRLLGRGC